MIFICPEKKDDEFGMCPAPLSSSAKTAFILETTAPVGQDCNGIDQTEKIIKFAMHSPFDRAKLGEIGCAPDFFMRICSAQTRI